MRVSFFLFCFCFSFFFIVCGVKQLNKKKKKDIIIYIC